MVACFTVMNALFISAIALGNAATPFCYDFPSRAMIGPCCGSLPLLKKMRKSKSVKTDSITAKLLKRCMPNASPSTCWSGSKPNLPR